MCFERVPNLDWPHDLYVSPADPLVERRPTENGFLEEDDLAAARIEWLTNGDVHQSVVRFRYNERAR